MSISDTNRVGLSYVEEAAWASTPAGSNMQELNYTSESLKANINTVTSETIRSDRNISDIVKTGGGAGGDMSFEMRYGEYDEFIEGALFNDWVSTRVSTAVASAFFSGATIEATSSALNHMVSGYMVRVSDASVTADNGDYRVTDVVTSAGRTTITLADASSGSSPAFTSGVFTASTLLQGNHLRNGTTLHSYTVERSYADVSAFHVFEGMRIGSMTLEFATQAILTGTFGLNGKGLSADTSSVASTTTSPSVSDIMNASDNVGRIWEGGEAVTGIIFQNITVELTNNLRDQNKIGSADLAGIGAGRCEVTGTLTAYFEDNSLLTKFVNNTASNLRFQVTDEEGNSYIITLPRVKFTDHDSPAGGGNADVIQTIPFGATVDDTNTYAIQVDALNA